MRIEVRTGKLCEERGIVGDSTFHRKKISVKTTFFIQAGFILKRRSDEGHLIVGGIS